jgi:Asp-tRNA(Asn)/Glu-tRNA(Gln) amidotransferase A subunit family amidase
LSRNPDSPFKTRQDIADAPDMAKSIPPSKAAQWKNPRPAPDLAQYARLVQAREQLMINIANVMAENRLDAIVHKTVEHQPGLINDAINPPYTGSRGVPMLNTFLIHAASMTVPSGFTSDNLPVGITFFGRPYSEPKLLKLAYAYEQATHHRKPPSTTPPLPARRSPVATTASVRP